MAQKLSESATPPSRCNQDADESSAGGKKRKRKEVFPYGNYRAYYGYRVGKDAEEDLRFRVLKEEWFKGKDCLDIGCNSGIMTISIAQKFHCKTILGVDIDHERIKDAQRNLQKISKIEKIRECSKNTVNTDALHALNGLECAKSLSQNKERSAYETGHPALQRSLLDVVSFRHENFVESQPESPIDHYDTIICLSVTKWVQLNWGDNGLIKLFTKIWRLLHPGGILILEPQPWKSYCNNRLVTETTAANFRSIMFYPRYFQEILIDKIGFRAVENAALSVDNTTPGSGFNRPVLVLRK
ncbi:hypothetical protein Droror1_Dr00006115 [Drosera rotundifolia]